MDGIRPGQMKLGKLEGEDCKSLRALWEEVFYGDSRKFTDYYFKEKAALNHGYVLRDGEMPASMLYLSPYPVMLRSGDTFACRELNYIVGVATKEPYRHRGCMDRLLKEALRDMYGKAQPFTFLMPADCAIYRPYQFTYIYRRTEYTLGNGPVTGMGKTCTMGGMKKMGKEDLPFLAEFAQAYMERHYDVFIRRDIPYFTRMEKELQAQEGGIFLAGEKDGIKGYLLYAEEEQGEIQEAVWEGEYGAWGLPAHPTGQKTPVIMARTVDAKAMLSLLRAKSGSITLRIRVSDPVLDGNNGIWNCVFTEDGAEVYKDSAGTKAAKNHREREKENAPALMAASAERAYDLELSIPALTSWVFGFGQEEKCACPVDGADLDMGEKVRRKLCGIRRLEHVFLNEIV